jgi:hypothetical protein
MNARLLQSNLLKFFRKMKRSRVPGWGLQAALLLTLLACSGLSGGLGGGGGPDNPFAGGALDGAGGGSGGQFTGEPGGQVTEDGVVRRAPKMVRVRVQDGGNTNKSLARWDYEMGDPPMAELTPQVTGPFVMVQTLYGRVEVVFPTNVMQKDISLQDDTDGEVDIALDFAAPENTPCLSHFRVWACKISEGQYYESQVLELSCPIGYYDNPYGTNAGDQNTTLILQQAPSKPCPNPVPQPADTNQAF